jgi:adenine-specific DNA-methyltransferase
LIEMEPSISREVTARRIEKYSRKNSVGGFQYCTLGPTLFDAAGRIRPEVSFAELARFVYFHATGGALAQAAAVTSPLLGVHHDTAVYLLYNGILKDKSAGGGNALTRQVLAGLPAHAGPKLIYGVRSLLGADRLRREGVTFRHIPTDLQL